MRLNCIISAIVAHSSISLRVPTASALELIFRMDVSAYSEYSRRCGWKVSAISRLPMDKHCKVREVLMSLVKTFASGQPQLVSWIFRHLRCFREHSDLIKGTAPPSPMWGLLLISKLCRFGIMEIAWARNSQDLGHNLHSGSDKFESWERVDWGSSLSHDTPVQMSI